MTSNYTAKVTISAVDRFSNTISNFQRSMRSLQNTAQNLGRSMMGVDRAARRFGGRLQSVAFRAMAVSTAFGAMMIKGNGVNESLIKNAEKIGVNVNQLQAMQYAAQQTGATSEEMTASLTSLTHALVDAQNPSSQAARAFSAMGIKTKDANGNIRDAISVFLEMADVFKKNPDGARKLLTAQALGLESVIHLLNLGTADAKKLAAAFEKIGFMHSKESIANTEKFNRTISNFRISIEKLSQTILAKLLPVFQPMIESMSKATQNMQPKQINQITKAVESLGKGIFSLATGFLKTAVTANNLLERIGGLGLVIKVMAGVWLTSLAVSFALLLIRISAVTKALYLFSLTPLGAVIAGILAIAALAAIIYIKWEPIKKFFSDLWASLGNGMIKIAELFKRTFGDGTLGKILLGLFTPLLWTIDKIIAGVRLIKGAFSSLTPPAPASMPNGSASMYPSSVGGFPSPAISSIAQAQTNKVAIDVNIKSDSGTATVDKVKSDKPAKVNVNTGNMMATV